MALTISHKVLCASTIPNTSFRERVQTARNAGFHVRSLFPNRYQKAKEQEGLSDAEMRQLMMANDIVIAEIDALLNWVLVQSPKDVSSVDSQFGGNEGLINFRYWKT